MKFFLLFFLLFFFTACSTSSVHREPAFNPQSLKKIYVEHRFSDGRDLDQLIAVELRRLGYDASSGPLTMMPDGVDAVVSYSDYWNWDFSLYLIELDIEVSDFRTGKILGTSSHRHPGSGKSPAEMVAAAIDPLFKRS